MYKLLIVDDEKQIREGLTLIIDWEQYGIDKIYQAGNGREALDIIRSESPEIMITDIQMEVMDGLELLEKINRDNINIRSIVLSGYDDYALVRRAMRSGAIDYLLKPISGDDLIQIIDEVTEDIENNRLSKTDVMDLSFQRSIAINRLVCGEISPSDFKSRMNVLEYSIAPGACCMGILSGESISENNDDNVDDDNSISMADMIFHFIEKSNVLDKNTMCFVDGYSRVCFMFWNIADDFYKSRYVEDIVNTINEEYETDYRIILGKKSKSFRSSPESYTSAIKAMNFIKGFPDKAVLSYDDVAMAGDPVMNMAPVIDEEKYVELVSRCDIDGALKEISNSLDEFKDDNSPKVLAAVKNGATEYAVLTCYGAVGSERIDKQREFAIKDEIIKKIYSSESVQAIFEIIFGYVKAAMERVNGSFANDYSKLVSDMVKRAEFNYYEEDLSLQILADEYGANAAYIGRQFKKETGVSFNDYLNNVRVEKAKELLATTDIKGSELSKKLGFANYNYFYLVFKKKTGENPMSYREH